MTPDNAAQHRHDEPRRAAEGEARQQELTADGETREMTKSELIDRLAARYPQLVAKDAELAVKMILDAMAESLAKGERIEIRGFGSFGLNYRPPRTGRNPEVRREGAGAGKARAALQGRARSCASAWMRWSGNRSSKTDPSATDSRNGVPRGAVFFAQIRGQEHIPSKIRGQSLTLPLKFSLPAPD